MKNLVSITALGAVVAFAPFAANAAAQAFDTTTTSSVSLGASLTKPANATASAQTVPSNPLLVTDKVLVEAYNDAVSTAVSTINSQIAGLSVSGGGDITSSLTALVRELITQNINVASSWSSIKTSPTSVQTTSYFQTAS